MTSFLALFAALNRKKVQYLVAGGWAVNLYGIERATGDCRPQDLADVYYLKQIESETYDG